MARKLEGKIAVVTGASKGIGAEIARQLAAEGASVVVNYATSRSGADKVVKDITDKGGKAVAVQANVAKRSDIEKLFAETKKAFGRVDVLVNNAGVYDFVPLENTSEESFKKMFDLNVYGLIQTTREAVKHMPESGGSIVNISSVVATLAPANSAEYSGTKGAVNSITRALGSELGPRKIRVNAVNPGLVETEGTSGSGFTSEAEGGFRKMIEAQTPLRRIGKPDDIAPAVVFLASDDAKWITCETLYISGGYR